MISGFHICSGVRHLFGWLLKFPMLILDIPFLTFSAKVTHDEKQKMISRLQPGDIILTADKLFPVWQWIMRVFWSSDYSHAAIYEGNGNVIEATTFHPSGDGVARTDAEQFFSGYKNFCILRPPYNSAESRNDAVAFAVSQLGNSYDYSLNPENVETMYCSKLAAMSLQSSGIGILPRSFGKIFPKKFFIPDDFIAINGMTKIYAAHKERRKNVLPYFMLIISIILALIFSPMPLFYVLFPVVVSALAGWLQLIFVKPSPSIDSDLKHYSVEKLKLLKNEQIG